MEDWQKRLLAEYNELKERYERLDKFINGQEIYKIEVKGRKLFYEQYYAMKNYLDILKKRCTLYELL